MGDPLSRPKGNGRGLTLEEEVFTLAHDVDQTVTLCCVMPTRVRKHEEEPTLPRLGAWAAAVGDGRRFSFGRTAHGALEMAKRAYYNKET